MRNIANMENQSEMFRIFMKFQEIYRRSQNQPSPEETLSGRDAEMEPATRHPATYCQPVPSGSSSTTTFDPCVVCKGKHPLWKCSVFKEKTPTQRAKVVADSKMCFSCINGKHPAKDCPKELKCSHPGYNKSHNVLLHGAERVYPQAQKPKPKSDSTSAAPAATKAPVTSTGVTGVTDVKGLLLIAAVTISSKGKTESVLALCDGGCTHSWISGDLSNNLGLMAHRYN